MRRARQLRIAAFPFIAFTAVLLALGSQSAALADTTRLLVDRQAYVFNGPADPYTDPTTGQQDQVNVHVGMQLGQETARAFFHLDLAALPSGASVNDLLITLKENGDETQNFDQSSALLKVCPLKDELTSQFNPSQPPAADCSLVQKEIDGTRASDGTWTFNLKGLLPYWDRKNTGGAIIPVQSSPVASFAVAFTKSLSQASVVFTPPASVEQPAPQFAPAASSLFGNFAAVPAHPAPLAVAPSPPAQRQPVEVPARPFIPAPARPVTPHQVSAPPGWVLPAIIAVGVVALLVLALIARDVYRLGDIDPRGALGLAAKAYRAIPKPSFTPASAQRPSSAFSGTAALALAAVVVVAAPSTPFISRGALGAIGGLLGQPNSTTGSNRSHENGGPAAELPGQLTPGASAIPGAANPTGGTVTALAGQAAGPNRNTYQGVTDSRITVVVGIQHQPCGQDPSQVMAKALPNPDPEGTTRAAVDYFNKHALAAFGHDIPASAQGQFSNGYYGRQMQAVIADDHGEFCPEQSKADAQQAMDTIKPFAVMGGSDEWDDEAFSRRLIRIDGDPLTDQFFVQHRPYFWCPITGASKVNVLLSQYAAKYLKDSNSTNTGDPTTASKLRKFGLIYLDSPAGQDDVRELERDMGQEGINNIKAVAYEPNLGTIGEQATNIILQMKSAGVTTIFMVMDPIAVEFISQSADNQNYRPEWISNTYGLMDWSLGPRSFMSNAQASNTFGISVFWPSRFIDEHQTEAWQAWHTEHSDSDPPSDWLGTYLSFKQLYMGIALAGPDLTPASFEQGLFSHCHHCFRSDPYMPLIGYGPGDYTSVDDAHIQKYDPNQPDYSAAHSYWSNGQPPKGAYVFPDGGRRYLSFFSGPE